MLIKTQAFNQVDSDLVSSDKSPTKKLLSAISLTSKTEWHWTHDFKLYKEGQECSDLELLSNLKENLYQSRIELWDKPLTEFTKNAIEDKSRQIVYVCDRIEHLKLTQVYQHLETNPDEDLVTLAATYGFSVTELRHKLEHQPKPIRQESPNLDRSRLQQLENIIEDGLSAFYEVGKALIEIRDSRLYKNQGYSSFESYCQKRWEMKRNYANKTIAAACVVANIKGTNGTQKSEIEMSPIGTQNDESIKGTNGTQKLEIENETQWYPTNERQVRPLTKLTPEQQKEAWNKAVSTAPHGKITANHVEKIVKEMTQKPVEPKPVMNFKPGDRVLVGDGELATVVEQPNEFEVKVKTWKNCPLQDRLIANIKPVEKKYIMACGLISIEQMARLQAKYESLTMAIEDLLIK